MPTPKQIKAAKKVSENIRNPKPKPMGEVLRSAGYSKETSKKPKLVTQSKGWAELMEEYLPDNVLMKTHQRLLNIHRIEHMIFPLGPKTRKELEELEKAAAEKDKEPKGDKLEPQPQGGALLRRAKTSGESMKLADEDIIEMIAEVGCKVRRIVHAETARHVYFWSPDANAQKAAVELGYKIKGRLTNKIELNGPEGGPPVLLVKFAEPIKQPKAKAKPKAKNATSRTRNNNSA